MPRVFMTHAIPFSMKKIKKALRFIVLLLLILLAVCGLSITGGFLTGNKERYLNNEIKTEQVDKKEEEDSDKT